MKPCLRSCCLLDNKSLLSIVVTSYTTERLKDIFSLLDSIKSQTYPNIEAIFVIERSRELYAKISTYSQEKNFQNLRLIFSNEKLGISEARNVGIKSARGDIVAFTDDDAVLFPNWAEEVVLTFKKDNRIIGVTGPVLPLWEDPSLDWFPEEFYWMIGCSGWTGLKVFCETDYAWGVNMSFRREAFANVSFNDGYSEGAQTEGKCGPVGDDVNFSYNAKAKTGKRIIYNPSLRVLHRVGRFKVTSKYIRRYSYWQGYSDALHKHTSDAHSRKKTESFLLNKIVQRLIPSILKRLTKDQNVAFKQLRVVVESLLFFSIGYLSYVIPSFFPITSKLLISNNSVKSTKILTLGK